MEDKDELFTNDPAAEETPVTEETGTEETPVTEETVPETPDASRFTEGETYEWDGRQFIIAKKKKGLKVFAFCVCLALIAACVALGLVIAKYRGISDDRIPGSMTYDTGEQSGTEPIEGKDRDKGKDKNKDKDKDKDKSEENAGETESSREYPGSHSAVIRPAGDETYSMADLYERCAPACCTIYVPVSGGAVLGSGFVVDAENGYVVTNHHVIERAGKTITVKFYDGRQFDAELVGSDEATDIAVLRIEAEGLTELPLGDSSNARVGDPVIAIGTPYSENLAGTLTNGMISGVDRQFEVKDYYGRTEKIMKLIQTNAAINSGNSGGPLINMQGQVIGINVMKLVDEYEGLGFAIPMSSAVTVINNLIDYGKVVDRTDLVTTPAKLGITASTLSPNDEELRKEYDLPQDLPEGVLVIETTRSTAVYKAGLRQFDIITAFNGEKVEKFDDLKAELGKYSVGDKVTLTFYRFETGEETTIEFVLEK